MTFQRLRLIGYTHAPEALRKYLASAGVLPVEATGRTRSEDLDGTALWVHTGGATRLHNAGVPLGLLSPGPSWLSTVPGNLLGRRLACTTLGELRNVWKGPGVIRLAEQGFGTLARETVYNEPRLFIDQLRKYRARSGLLDSVHVIASAPVEYPDRYRFFVAHGEITTSTRVSRQTLSDSRPVIFEVTGEDRSKEAQHFAQKVLDATAWHQPPGFRIDVGTTADGTWHLISAGPSWNADVLEAEPYGAVMSILAGQEPGHDHWKWVPDELFQSIITPSFAARIITS